MIDAQIAGVIGIVSALFSGGISYGLLKGKVDRVEKDLERAMEMSVTGPHFESVIRPMQEAISEVQKDIKTMLLILSRKERGN